MGLARVVKRLKTKKLETVMKRKRRKALLEPLEPRLLLDAVLWDGGGDGVSWTDRFNWSADLLPTADDDVTINVESSDPTIVLSSGTHSIRSLTSSEALTISGGSLALAADSQIHAAFTLSGGTLTGNGDLTLTDAMLWTAGSMTGGGLVVVGPGAAFTASGGGTKDLSRVLEVQGTLEYTGSNFRFGPTGDPGIVHILPGAAFNAVGDGDFGVYNQGAHEIRNEGTFIRSGTGTTTVHSGIVFNSSGTVEVQEGTLQLSGGGAQSGTLAGPGLMEITGGTHTLEGLSGTADLRIIGGAVQVSGDGVDISGTTTSDGRDAQWGQTFGRTAGSMSWSAHRRGHGNDR
jgi:hypothetical protein